MVGDPLKTTLNCVNNNTGKTKFNSDNQNTMIQSRSAGPGKQCYNIHQLQVYLNITLSFGSIEKHCVISEAVL